MYQAWKGIEVSANVFARQGYPFPLFRQQAVGADSLSVLVTPAIDTLRYPNLRDTDARVAKKRPVQRVQRGHQGEAPAQGSDWGASG
jgi:hypothetical protein